MKKLISLLLIFCFLSFNTVPAFAFESIDAKKTQKHPRYDNIFLNEDKYENFNRKIFDFNLKMNKIFVRNIHIIWASVMPNFLIDSLSHAYSNIEYPKRLISSLLQRDFDAVKNETKRFLINTIIGFGGLIDVAYKIFNLEMYNEDIEQALAKCKVKCGSYLVLPFISSTSSRDIIGRIFDFLLNPTTYIASPVAAAIKMGLLINRTAYIQPIVKMVESNFSDPYDIARKFFGIEKYIKLANYDRLKVLESIKNDYDEVDLVDNTIKRENKNVKGRIHRNENLIVHTLPSQNLTADIILENYNPQNPVLDSMRTALFDIKDTDKKFWKEISVWNRNFSKKIQSAEVEITKDRPKYKFRYALQKNKTSPLVLIFPSVGEGINSAHNDTIAEIFYNEGYSVIIFGSHFQWEFLKSTDKNHQAGIIKDDMKYINKLVNNSTAYLSKKYDRFFLKRTAIGTSLGAYAILFLAADQYEKGACNIDKFIAICPPFDLVYAIEQVDKIIDSWKRYPDDFKEKVAITAAKAMRAYNNKEKLTKNFTTMPLSNYEAKLITAYIFHQKLSDIIYMTNLKEKEKIDNKEFYTTVYKTNYRGYFEKYLLTKYSYDEIKEINSLSSISDYLINNDNYKIYHSLDDYLINKDSLKKLKGYCDNKLVLFSNGSHLGFLYRNEFINELKNEIKLN